MLKLTYEGRTLQRAGLHPARATSTAPPRCTSATGAPTPDAPAPAWASTPTDCAPPKALWQDIGLDAEKTGGSTNSPPRRTSTIWRRRPPPHHSPRRPRGVQKEPRGAARRRRESAAGAHALPGVEVRRLRLGHGDRPQLLHRVRRLRHRLPGGKQHRRGRQGPGAPRPRHALAARRFLLPGRRERSGDLQPARALHALRERALRTGLPRAGHHAQLAKA